MHPRSPASTSDRLQRNLASIRARIDAARARGPHAAGTVELVVVTKSVPTAVFGPLAEAGVRTVGENRVQSAAVRRPKSPGDWTWHGIGHLQRNKARTALAVFDVFQALDSLRLAERLDALLAAEGRTWPVYLQVNTAGDDAKGGFRPDEALDALRRVAALPALEVLGFMTMGRLGAEERDLRRTFRTLREIRDEGSRLGVGAAEASGLSMGMSDDFEIAVEEGATTVRIGRAVFDGVDIDRTPVSRGAGGEPGSVEEHA